jgi:uncharacterized membrane protein YGL010W
MSTFVSHDSNVILNVGSVNGPLRDSNRKTVHVLLCVCLAFIMMHDLNVLTHKLFRLDSALFLLYAYPFVAVLSGQNTLFTFILFHVLLLLLVYGNWILFRKRSKWLMRMTAGLWLIGWTPMIDVRSIFLHAIR